MNTHDSGRLPADLTDDQILGSVRRRMIAVEDLIPAPAPWHDRPGFAKPGAIHVTSRLRLGGMPLAIVAIVAIVALGLGFRQYVASGPGESTNWDWTTLTYRLDGGTTIPSGADVQTAAEIIAGRLGGGDAQVSVSGGQITVLLSPGTDISGTRAIIEAGGQAIEFVTLPADKYGTLARAGQTALPKPGDKVDPSLPAAFTGTQVAGAIVEVAASPSGSSGDMVLGAVMVRFLPSVQAAANTWAAGHSGSYVAAVVDGKVASVGSIPIGVSSRLDFSFTFGRDLGPDEVQALAVVLDAGQLPAPLVLVSISAAPAPQGYVTPSAPPTAPPTTVPTGVPSWSTSSSSGAPAYVQGSATAPVTLEVWIDYQCTNCKTFHDQVLPTVVSSYVSSGKVKIVFHDLIVIDGNVGGTESLDAANAARCAADMGRYEAYRDLLFATQGAEGSGTFTKARLVDLGVRLGLDRSTFEACINAGTHDADVAADSAAAGARGLPGIPSVAVNGQLLNTYDVDTIRRAIDSTLNYKSPTPPSAPSVFATP